MGVELLIWGIFKLFFQHYLRKHAYGNAVADDLWSALSKVRRSWTNKEIGVSAWD